MLHGYDFGSNARSIKGMIEDPSLIAAEIEALFLQVLSPHLFELSGRGKLPKSSLKEIVNAVSEMSRSYNDVKQRDDNLIISTKSEAISYAHYYGTINSAKVAHLLNLISVSTKPLRVLDFGCGPGTSSLSMIQAGHRVECITAIESSHHMLDVFSKALRKIAPNVPLSSYANLSDIRLSNFDIIFCCNVLNEVEESQRFSVISSLRNHLSENGILMILEPGNFDSTRALMNLRDKVVDEFKDLAIAYPCTHYSKCPMINEPTQWCHSSIRWQRPSLIQQIDELTGFNKHEIKYSALVLQRTQRIADSRLRVIREPIKSKTGFRIGVCGQGRYGVVCVDPRSAKIERKTLKNLGLHALLEDL